MEETPYPRDAFNRHFPLEDALNCIGPGWKTSIITLWEFCKDNKISIHQIKEKFGGLRFYFAVGDKKVFDKMTELVTKAENESFNHCELCGQPGKLRDSLRWFKTLCEEHYKLAVDDYETYRKLIWKIGENHTAENTHLFSPEALVEIRNRFRQGDKV
jgi:hypothetical protein